MRLYTTKDRIAMVICQLFYLVDETSCVSDEISFFL